MYSSGTQVFCPLYHTSPVLQPKISPAESAVTIRYQLCCISIRHWALSTGFCSISVRLRRERIHAFRLPSRCRVAAESAVTIRYQLYCISIRHWALSTGFCSITAPSYFPVIARAVRRVGGDNTSPTLSVIQPCYSARYRNYPCHCEGSFAARGNPSPP